MNRSVDALKRISTESGLPIIASGGYYMQRTYPAEIAAKSADQIADELAKEAAASRFGAFGEIGQQGGVMTDDERKVFTAIAKAHARTGLPIFTHNAYTGTRPTQNPVPKDTAIKQLDLLLANGVKPQNLAIGHVCCLDDPKAEIPIEIAKRGAYRRFRSRDHRARARRAEGHDDHGDRRGRPRLEDPAGVGLLERARPEEKRRRRPRSGRHRVCADAGEGGNAGGDVEDDPERQPASVPGVRTGVSDQSFFEMRTAFGPMIV